MNVKKIKSKTSKDFTINGNVLVNVVTVTDSNGITKKFYNVDTGTIININKINQKVINIGSTFHIISDDPTQIDDLSKKLDDALVNIQELKEMCQFIKNSGDVQFEREEKLKRLTK